MAFIQSVNVILSTVYQSLPYNDDNRDKKDKGFNFIEEETLKQVLNMIVKY